ncbi:MAG: tetratricopeptide repeat protein [Longimonas sp.]|uniref:tetratricopeptide repeat protein n=1 Tax=Longimonas sp. TaxID=2039626 RepID=UPI003358F7D7
MSSLKTPEKSSRRKELRSNSIVDLYARSVLFFEENKNAIYAAGVGLVVLIAAVGVYFWNVQQTEAEAQRHLGQIERLYAMGEYERALQGTGDLMGLLEIADTYSGTDAGNLAVFYVANAYLRNDLPDEAMTYLERFDKDRDLIGASALAAEASIFEDRGDYETAGARYERAAEFASSAHVSPQYLMNAGRAYEAAGNLEQARRVYSQIQTEYADSPEAERVQRFLARVEARQARTAS